MIYDPVKWAQAEKHAAQAAEERMRNEVNRLQFQLADAEAEKAQLQARVEELTAKLKQAGEALRCEYNQVACEIGNCNNCDTCKLYTALRAAIESVNKETTCNHTKNE